MKKFFCLIFSFLVLLTFVSCKDYPEEIIGTWVKKGETPSGKDTLVVIEIREDGKYLETYYEDSVVQHEWQGEWEVNGGVYFYLTEDKKSFTIRAFQNNVLTTWDEEGIEEPQAYEKIS